MITRQLLEEIGETASAQPLSEALLAELRSRYPEVHFTYCMDDDVMAARPLYENPAFNLYLIDSRDHCLCFTQELDVATGVVLAEIEADQ